METTRFVVIHYNEVTGAQCDTVLPTMNAALACMDNIEFLSIPEYLLIAEQYDSNGYFRNYQEQDGTIHHTIQLILPPVHLV